MNSNPTDARGEWSATFVKTIEELGRKLEVDPRELADGAPAQWQGLAFWILDHRGLDPQGITVAVRTATLPVDGPVMAYRQLLNHNAVLPAGLNGFFAMMPDSDEVLYCIRFDLARTVNAAQAVLEMIEGMAMELTKSLHMLAQEISKASTVAPSLSL